MIDLSLLRVLRERGDFDTYYGHIPLNAVEKRTAVLAQDIAKYYKAFPEHKSIDFIAFRDLFFQQWHRGMDPDSTAYFDKVLSRMDAPCDAAVKSVLMNSLLELKFATDVGNILQSYQGGEEIPVIKTIQAMTEKVVDKMVKKEQASYEDPDFATLMQDDMDDSGLPWRNPAISQSIRKLRDGDFIIAAGRPDKGKTSFIADTATHMAADTADDRPVLWLSNEGLRDNIV